MRIDKLLWFLRLTKTRSMAQTLVNTGHLRRHGQRIERCALEVVIGDRLVIPLPHGVLVIELTSLPSRRGPPAEAQSCYRVLDAGGSNPIAAANEQITRGKAEP